MRTYSRVWTAFAPCPPRKRRLPAPQSTPRCALEGGIPTGKAPHPALRGNGRAQRAAHDNMGSGRFPANATSQGFALGRGCFIAYCPRSGGCEARTAMRKKANPFPRKKAHGQDRRKAASGCFGQRLGLAHAPARGVALPGHALIGPRQTSGRAGGPGRCPSPQRKNCHDQAESEAIFASRASCASGPRSLASREAPLPASLLPCFAGFFIPLAVCWLCRQTGPVAMTARRYPASRLGLAVGKEAAGHAP